VLLQKNPDSLSKAGSLCPSRTSLTGTYQAVRS
jgi:hypothetical protein